MSYAGCRRLRIAPIVTVGVALVLVGLGCGGSGVDAPRGGSANRPLGQETLDDATLATDLAPSQVGASTVPPPTLVPACDAEAIEFAIGDRVDGVDQVVELINRGSVRCDVDISGTVGASADIEPSVVLGPGEIGHVWVSDRGGCDRSLADPQVEFDVVVNGVTYPVETTFVASCGVELWAFFTD